MELPTEIKLNIYKNSYNTNNNFAFRLDTNTNNKNILYYLLMENKIINFKNNLIETYNEFPELYNYISDTSYVKFLYCHMNEVEVIVSDKLLKGDNILSTELNVNNNYKTNISLIYRKYLSETEKKIIDTGKFYVMIIEKSFPEVTDSSDNEILDKYFDLKNRRDFLIPMFFHKLTIDTFSKFNINNIESYRTNLKDFFKLLVQIRKYIKTKERLGVMLDSSFTLNLHNLRKSADLDLVVLHPRYYDTKVKDNMKNITDLDFVDNYIPNIIIDWKQKTTEILDKNTKEFSDNKLQSFNEVIFDPSYHYYFFGIKIISLEYDLKYRAKRRFPKNVADIILAKDKLKIDVPKISKLEPVIQVLKNTYDTEKFIKVVSNYLKKFNHPVDNIEEKINDLY